MDLDRVEVTADASGAVSVFNCAQQIKDGAKAVNLPKFWVSSRRSEPTSYDAQSCSDGFMTSVLSPDLTFHACLQKTAQYDLTLYTSDIRGAGTDADVYLTLSGDNGSADEIKLYNGPQNFARAATDKFSFVSKDVGSNKKLTFRLVRAEPLVLSMNIL